MSEQSFVLTAGNPYRVLRRIGGRYIKQPLRKAQAAWSERRLKRSLFGEWARLVPPVSLMYDGPADLRVFKANGEEFLKILREKCGLLPSHSLLDVGCGIGRKTLPLLTYLTPPQGRYEGVDIAKSGIDWCQARFTPRFPHFRFQLMNVYNGVYNPTATVKACEYRFPFADNSFDAVLLGSVFTHTMVEDTWNYLSEIRRMLKPGGRCLISYFLLNEESERLMAEGKSKYAFVHPLGRCKVVDPANPEAAIAYQEQDILDAYQDRSLEIEGGINYGSWCGRKDFLSFQDLVIATKA
jgi:SAM-dependent methyltransferase